MRPVSYCNNETKEDDCLCILLIDEDKICRQIGRLIKPDIISFWISTINIYILIHGDFAQTVWRITLDTLAFSEFGEILMVQRALVYTRSSLITC